MQVLTFPFYTGFAGFSKLVDGKASIIFDIPFLSDQYCIHLTPQQNVAVHSKNQTKYGFDIYCSSSEPGIMVTWSVLGP